MATLTGLELYTYRIGFGDCFLLRFEYGADARHVLIDFGTSANPERMGSQKARIAAHVAATCGGKLDAIVVTHRHGDHLSGFAGETWEVIEGLEPGLVVLPWTEHPDAATDARVAPTGTRGKIGARSCAHVRSLDAMHAVAEAALRELERRSKGKAGSDDDDAPAEEAEVLGPWAGRDLGPSPVGAPFGKRLAAELQLVGDVNLKNKDAVENLLSTRAQDFVSFGSRTRLEKLLPGVKVHVLGPPTLAQSSAIHDMRDEDRAEYWHVMAAAGRAAARVDGQPLFPGVRTVSPDRLPLETRWFLKRLDAVRAGELLQIVRALDDVLNNTSVILLFEVLGPKGKKLLFPGDAQLEDWSYALSHDEVRDLLEDVDVYKVGHHGSLNATPKSLWNRFSKLGSRGTPGRLRTFLSTRRNKHGHRENGTEVPRGPLLDALQARSELVSTLDMTSAKELCHVERII
jgi:beta-lactamase superfamily II metal-dependent hydrolase